MGSMGSMGRFLLILRFLTNKPNVQGYPTYSLVTHFPISTCTRAVGLPVFRRNFSQVNELFRVDTPEMLWIVLRGDTPECCG